MKRNKRLMSLLVGMMCIPMTVPVYAAELVEQRLEFEFDDKKIVDEDLIVTDVTSIVNTNVFDEKEIYEGGLQAITTISEDIPEFYYWQKSEVVDFKFLHSFNTGYVTHALFEILGSNGEYGCLIYDCENQEADSFCASESPYKLADDAISKELSAEISMTATASKPYYFYAPMSYGYGVINESGTMDIYNIRDIVSDTEIEVLYDVSFVTEKVESAENRVRTVVGDKESVAKYEARRNAIADDSIGTRAVSYPTYHLISGVPDYLQDTGYMCITLSMSNIIGYWDENGFPDLVPSAYNSDREEYIPQHIYDCLEAQEDGPGDNDSIDPAFEMYIEEHGEYRYYGISIWNPDYVDLKAEIYSYELPCMVGFESVYGGGHSTTGVGYSCSSGEQVIVHDNWGSTPKNMYQDWSDVDFMFSCSISNPW